MSMIYMLFFFVITNRLLANCYLLIVFDALFLFFSFQTHPSYLDTRPLEDRMRLIGLLTNKGHLQ